MSGQNVRLVMPVSELEDYPIDRAERLDAHSFVKWMHHRWMASRTFKMATWEVQGMVRALYDMAQNESPIGTLPDDDAELAFMLRVDRSRLADLRKMEFGPFRGWRRCRCGEEIRLMHPVVLEQVRDALDRRDTRSLSADAKAEYQRIKRLKEGLKGLGLDDRAIGDDVLINRMDSWLKENRKGRRDRGSYEAVIMHAQKSRWFGAVEL